MNKTEQALIKILELTDEQRYLLAGEIILKKELGMSPPNPGYLIKEGERWLNEQIKKVRIEICKNDKIKDLVNHIDEFNLALSIIDLVLDKYFDKLPAAVISSQVVKNGLNLFCHDIWEKNKLD